MKTPKLLNTVSRISIFILIISFKTANSQHECNIENLSRDYSKFPIALDADTEIPEFQSLPGAPNTIYLDFDGEVVTNTWWTQHVVGDEIDAEPTYFTTSEKENICKIVAADFHPWNVNVTTNREVFDATHYSDRAHVIFTSTNFYPGSPGGVAKNGSFPQSGIAWVFNSHPIWSASTASHEVGHTISLGHSGKGDSEYYFGHGNWRPIMGSGLKEMTTWDNGGYDDATSTSPNHIRLDQYLGLRPDDWSSSHEAPSALAEIMTSSFEFESEGMISTPEDRDIFMFTTMGGAFSLTFGCDDDQDRNNLRIEASILSLDKTVISSSATTSKSAIINTVLAPGTYYLQFDGVGYLTVNTGYSDYGSRGKYNFSGSVVNLTESKELSVVSVNDLPELICSETIEVSVNVKNHGSEIANNYLITVFNDEGIMLIENITTPINPGETKAILLTVTPNAYNDFYVSAEVSISGDIITENNASSAKNVKNLHGENITFEASDNTLFYDYFWSVISEDSGHEIIASNDIVEVGSGGLLQQDFCLPKDSCYLIEVVKPFLSNSDWCNFGGYNHLMPSNYSPDHVFQPGDSVLIYAFDGPMNFQLYEILREETQSIVGSIFTPSSYPDLFSMISCEQESSDSYFTFKEETIGYKFIDQPYELGYNNYNFDFCTDNLISSVEKPVVDSFSLYPNPSNGMVYLNSKEFISSIEVYNNVGQLVLSINNSKKFDVSDFSPGYYSVLANKNSTQKLIVK